MNNLYSYTTTAKLMHWLMAVIWIFVWIIGILAVYGRELFNPNHGLTLLHKALASTLLFLIVIRILWRLTHKPPPLPDSMSQHVKQMAKLGHIALYLAALICMPMSGWLMSSFAGRPVLFAGLFELPALVSPDPNYVATTMTIHIYLAWFCGLLVAGHILIALKHHFIDKDNILTSMAPNYKRQPHKN